MLWLCVVLCWVVGLMVEVSVVQVSSVFWVVLSRDLLWICVLGFVLLYLLWALCLLFVVCALLVSDFVAIFAVTGRCVDCS